MIIILNLAHARQKFFCIFVSKNISSRSWIFFDKTREKTEMQNDFHRHQRCFLTPLSCRNGKNEFSTFILFLLSKVFELLSSKNENLNSVLLSSKLNSAVTLNCRIRPVETCDILLFCFISSFKLKFALNIV